MPVREMQLEFPAAGQSTRLAFQKQSPFTSPQMSNVRPVDVLEDKRRGGSRPWLAKALTTELGTDSGTDAGTSSGTTFNATTAVFQPHQVGEVITMDNSPNRTYTITAYNSPTQVTIGSTWNAADDNQAFTVSGSRVNLLNVLRTTNDTGKAVFTDALVSNANFNTSWSEVNATADFAATAGFATGPSTAAELEEGNVLNASIPDIEQNIARSVSILIDPINDTHYSIYANMDNTTPVKASSVSCRVTFQAALTTLTISVNDAQVASGTSTGGAVTGGNWLTLVFGPTSISATWEQTGFTVNYTTGVTASNATDAVGFGMERMSTGGVPTIDTLRVDYVLDGGAAPPEFVMAASNGQLYLEKPAGVFATVTSNITLSSTPIMSHARLGDLYIADYGERVSGTTGTVATDVLDDASGPADWTAITTSEGSGEQIVTAGDLLEIISATVSAGSLPLGWYKITTVHATNGLTITTLADAAVNATASAVTYRVVPAFKVYFSNTDQVIRWIATDTANFTGGVGILPYGARIISSFNDRIVLAGDPQYPGQWWMSAVGNPNGWAEDDTDVNSAVFGGSTDVDVLQNLGAPITAIMRFSREYLLMGTTKDLWLFAGDPRLGGSITQLSDNTGVVGPFAWCQTDRGQLYFLSRNGVYALNEQTIVTQSEPLPVSLEKIPKALRNIDMDTYEVFMAFDSKRNGFYIWVVPLDVVGQALLWFYDVTTEAFLPDTMANDHHPLSTVYSPEYDDVLLGCRDGYVRRFDETQTSDDGTAQTALVDIGPFRLNGGRAAMADTLEIVMSSGSSDVTWEYRAGQSAEEAHTAAFRATGTASAGVNYRQSIRQWGEWGVLRLYTTVAARWSIERIRLMAQQAGLSKKV